MLADGKEFAGIVAVGGGDGPESVLTGCEMSVGTPVGAQDGELVLPGFVARFPDHAGFGGVEELAAVRVEVAGTLRPPLLVDPAPDGVGPDGRIAPSTATIRRIITTVCPGGLADLLGCDPADADTLAVDGKSARGSRHGITPAAHLLAAMTGTGQTVTQLRVPAKTNEITCFAALLAPFDLTGVTVTADALHAQRDHARFLVEDKKAHYVLCVKKNRTGLFEQLHSLPWKEVTAKFYDRTEGHGRRETRLVQVLTVEDLDFPHAAQAARITRHRTCIKSGKRTRETVYVITDLTSRQASPQRLAKIARSQWIIENRLHFVRDVTFREDASKVHTGHGPQNMATLRSFAINQLRTAGHSNIAAGLREMSYEPFTRPLNLLGIA